MRKVHRTDFTVGLLVFWGLGAGLNSGPSKMLYYFRHSQCLKKKKISLVKQTRQVAHKKVDFLLQASVKKIVYLENNIFKCMFYFFCPTMLGGLFALDFILHSVRKIWSEKLPIQNQNPIILLLRW